MKTVNQHFKDRINDLETHIRILVETDPNELVSSGEHTVLDLWRRMAKKLLNESCGR